MKKQIALVRFTFLSLFVILCFGLTRSALAEKSSINLITGPFGTSSYVLGTALEDIARKYSDHLHISHTETPGIAYNLIKMMKKPQEKKNTVIANAISVVYMARNGSGPFVRLKKKFANDVQFIATYNAAVRFYVSRDPDLKEITDLKGKKIGLGTKQQAWGFAAMWDLTIAGGMKPTEFDAQLIGTDAAITAFQDHLVDAVVGGAYVNPTNGMYSPAPFFRKLTATSEKLYFINVGEKGLRRSAKALGVPYSGYTLQPEKTPGLDRPIKVSLGTVGWFAYPDFPEEHAYHLTRLLIDNVEKFAEYHGLGKLMTKELLCYDYAPEETHPGAYRAYREAGLMK